MTSLLPVAWMAVVLGFVATRVGLGRVPSWQRSAPVARRRRGRRGFLPPSRRRRADEVIDAIPDLVDLFAVATAAGLNPRLAVVAVTERAPPGRLTDALAEVCRQVTSGGARLADALDQVPDAVGSDAVRPLVRALTDAERYGSALGPSLERLADDARRARQRRAEEAARKLPVKLLFPLVVCILPAFGLLTVAPLIAGGLRALRL